MSHFFCLAISQGSASYEVLDACGLASDQVSELYQDLMATEVADGIVVLSTCHRLEIYAFCEQPKIAEPALAHALADFFELEEDDLFGALKIYKNSEVVSRLFRIASGLDSVSIGEAEVLGQVRRARLTALELGSSGPELDHLFERAVIAGKRVRSETRLGAGTLNLADMAVRVADEKLGGLHNHHAVVIGAGEYSRILVEALVRQGISHLTIINRCSGKARKLAEAYRADHAPLEESSEVFLKADVIFASTASRQALVTKENLAARLRHAPFRPLYLFDLSNPHNIEPDLNGDGVELESLPQLTKRIEQSRTLRSDEVENALLIMEQEEEKFHTYQRFTASREVVTRLRREMEAIRRKHVELHSRRFSPNEYDQLHKFSKSLTSALLHKLTAQLSSLDPDESEDQNLANAALELFDLMSAAEKPNGL